MGTAGQVEGLADALLQCVDQPDRIAEIQVLMDRYSHRLRNRLNSIKLSLYLARKLGDDPVDPDWSRADFAYRAMEILIEQLHAFCHPLSTAPTEGDLGQWMADRLFTWRRLLEERPIQLEADGPDGPLPVRCDWPRLGQGLDRLVESWAAQGPPDATIRVSWGVGPDDCFIRFESDGRVARPEAEVESLALPLLARVLHAHRGSMEIPEDAESVELRWPIRET